MSNTWSQVSEDIFVKTIDEFMKDDLTHLTNYLALNSFRYKSERQAIIMGAVLFTAASFILTLSNNVYVIGGAILAAGFALFSFAAAYTTRVSRYICVSIPSSDYYDVDVWGASYYVTVKKINVLRFTYNVPIDL